MRAPVTQGGPTPDRTTPGQPTLADIGEPLSATTFVVVDLETTGAGRGAAITEIGAVKTRGGEVIGEFQTLIDPGGPIPPMIVSLTGITDAMVVGSPTISQVLPTFLEFLGDAVLVAHNAPFDTGFLKAACRTHGYAWPGNDVVDTVTLARRATTKEEAPNKKLATLARVFGTAVQPTHRALDDARATSEVLHGLLERLAAFGITHREDLDTLRNPVPQALRRKATMADAVPTAAGVYIFRGPQSEALYVGTSRNLRARVKSYFTRGEARRGMRDMLNLAAAVDTIVCATAMEASVLEVRLIAQWRPRFNRRSAHPERTVWLRFTAEAYPRLTISRAVSVEEAALGPIRSASDARLIIEALEHACGLRTCRTRLPITPRANARACLLKDLGTCSAPCVRGSDASYQVAAAQAEDAVERDLSPVVRALEDTIADHVLKDEFERAADWRDCLAATVDAAERASRLKSLRACSLVAVRWHDDAWELASISRGVLTGTRRVTQGVWAAADELRALWHHLPVDIAIPEERELVLTWLEQDGTRLLYIDGEWSSPVGGAGRHVKWARARRDDATLCAVPDTKEV